VLLLVMVPALRQLLEPASCGPIPFRRLAGRHHPVWMGAEGCWEELSQTTSAASTMMITIFCAILVAHGVRPKLPQMALCRFLTGLDSGRWLLAPLIAEAQPSRARSLAKALLVRLWMGFAVAAAVWYFLASAGGPRLGATSSVGSGPCCSLYPAATHDRKMAAEEC
jgi:hypothetical protein